MQIRMPIFSSHSLSGSPQVHAGVHSCHSTPRALVMMAVSWWLCLLPGFFCAFWYSPASAVIFIKLWFLLFPSSEKFGAPGCPDDKPIANLILRALRVLPRPLSFLMTHVGLFPLLCRSWASSLPQHHLSCSSNMLSLPSWVLSHLLVRGSLLLSHVAHALLGTILFFSWIMSSTSSWLRNFFFISYPFLNTDSDPVSVAEVLLGPSSRVAPSTGQPEQFQGSWLGRDDHGSLVGTIWLANHTCTHGPQLFTANSSTHSSSASCKWYFPEVGNIFS